MRKHVVGVVVVSLAFATVSLFAQAGGKSKADPRLRTALDEVSLKYSEILNGAFRLQFTLGKERTQAVFAESRTTTIGIIEVREVWAIGWKGRKAPSAEIANKLLLDNAGKKVGAWELNKQADGGFYATFRVKAAADCDGEALKTIASAVAQTADQMEKEILGTDEF